MHYKIDLEENAKAEWMKLVKKTKKRQKGLPAMTKLNTNAGNVEHNVSMFNKMNSPVDGPSNNPISGPFGGDVSSSSDAGAAMGESLQEDLKTGAAYMLRNDGTLLYADTTLNVHPYIVQIIDQTAFQAIRDLMITVAGEPLMWFYKNTNKTSTKELIKHFVECLLVVKDHYRVDVPEELISLLDLNLTDVANLPEDENKQQELFKHVESTINFLNVQTNQEFCRVRTSHSFATSGNSKDIYFRVGSVNFNWFDLIWQTVYENRNWINSVTVCTDYSSKGVDQFYKVGNTIIHMLPVDEFINLPGNPVIESYVTNKFNKFFEDGYYEGFDCLYNPIHVVRNSNFLLKEVYDECFVIDDNSCTICEDIKMNNKTIELNYKDIPVEVTVGGSRSGYFDRNFGNWLPDDGREETIYIDWTYKITKNDAIEVLQDSKEVEKDLMVDGMTDEEFVQKIIDNLDDLVEKYEDELLDYYLEAATEHAQENYLNESVKADNKKLDDSFDMSLRTLL